VTGDTIRKFNRDTVWLAAGVLGTVVFAALVLAVQECQPKATQTGNNLLLNANPARAGSVLAKSSDSKGKLNPGLGSSVDHPFTEASIPEIPFSQTEAGAATTFIALPPVNFNGAQTNLDSRRKDSARAITPRVQNARRSSLASKTIDVKRRLIELWHKSLARSTKSRSWTAFSNLKNELRKKAAYTAETSH
jgi:hypothetical protein